MSKSATADEWMISVDDHLIEPQNVWVDRLPATYREVGPRWISDERGEAWLVAEDTRVPVSGAVTAGAVWPPEGRPAPFTPLRWSEVPPACYDPKAREEAMNTDHVLAAVMFPNLPGFAGSLFQGMDDKDLALLCIQAYNDWLLDEYCAAIPGRVIGLALIPMWDGKLAASEAERAIGKGARAVSFSMAPHHIGFPAIHDEHWDALYSVMNEANLPLCTHLGTGFAPATGRSQQLDFSKLSEMARSMGVDVSRLDRSKVEDLVKNGEFGKLMQMASGGGGGTGRTPRPTAGVTLQLAGQTTLIEWINSGNFDRYPNLKVALSENGIGWIPAVLQVADWLQEMSRNRITTPTDPENDPVLTEEGRQLAKMAMEARAAVVEHERTPTEIFKDHMYGCFIHDPVGLRLLDFMGADNIMIETDFPHNSTWWPHSADKAKEWCLDLPEDVRRKVLRGNAERVFDFTPAESPVVAQASG
jgi:predicted TIM-barrel fold metal-dependent hydrolase